jgi:hypothetical protein
MANSKERIQSRLNQSAQIIRKYELGDIEYFYNVFQNVTKSELETAWNLAQEKIDNLEIVKDSLEINTYRYFLTNEKVASFKNNKNKIYRYLKSDFNSKRTERKDKEIERRLRHILAEKYVKILSNEVFNILEGQRVSIIPNIIDFFDRYKVIILIFGFISLITAPRIINGLTPVEELTYKIHENSIYQFNGSVCNDGKISHSQGRGTCSWHKGVDHKFYKGQYSKTLNECREEAIKLSWRD